MLIYLASPYSHENILIRESRFRQACAAAAKIMQQGYFVYSPIAHSHPIELHFDKRQGHEFWLPQCYAVLRHCSRLKVLMLEGWKQSYGVNCEINMANSLYIPVEFIDP